MSVGASKTVAAGPFLRAAGQTICYHVHDGSYCDIGGVNELPSRQTGSVGRSGYHRPDCARRDVRLARRRDATSTVKTLLSSAWTTAPDLSGRAWQARFMRALTIVLCLLATPALADVAGVPSVIDGDLMIR